MNPFVKKYKLKVIKNISKQGEKKDGVKVSDSSYTSPYETNVKVYYSVRERKVSLTEMSLLSELFFEHLTNGSRDLFVYIMLNIQKNKDIITLNNATLKAVLKCGHNKIADAKSELIKHEVISKIEGTKDQYYVNTVFIFSGNRCDFFDKNYKENIDVKHARIVN